MMNVMDTATEFTVTEAGMRAVLETMTSMHSEMAVMAARLDALEEAVVIHDGRLDLVVAASQASAGFSPADLG